MKLKVIAVLGTLALILGILVVPAQPALAATTPSIGTYPSVVIKGERFHVNGDLGAVVDRPVTLQRLSGTTWKPLQTVIFGGWYDFESVSATRATTFRVVADPITVDGVTYPKVVLTKKVTPVGQSVKASMPKSGYQGKSLVVSVKTTPTKGMSREVRLQIKKAGKWVTTDAHAQTYSGKSALAFTTEGPGTYYYRVFVPSLDGTATMVTPKMKIKVKKRAGYHAKAIAVGGGFACAINFSNGVDCWGANVGGQKDTSDVVKKPSPVLGLTGVQAISARDSNICVLISGGQVECWGWNQHGELGPDSIGDMVETPQLIPGISGATAVSLGRASVCVILASKQVSCRGYNPDGQLGRAPATNSPTMAIIPGLSNVKAVAAGTNVTCAASEDGAVKCLGENTYGALGAGEPDSGGYAYSSTPVTAVGVSGTVALDSGNGWNSSPSCAVSGTGELRCWPGEAENNRLPRVVPEVTGATDVVVSEYLKCAVESGGEVKCWGSDDTGMAGRGDPDHPAGNTPLPVYFMKDATSVKLGFFACALRKSGQVSCWGSNDQGRLADGTVGGIKSTPTNVVAP